MEKIDTDYKQRKPSNRDCAPSRSNDVVLSSFLKFPGPCFLRSISHIIVIFFFFFCLRGKAAMRLTLCEALTRETRPDHDNGNYVPYSFGQERGFFNVLCKPYNTEDAGDGAYSL